MCPTGLLVEWRLMNSDLLGGPISEVQYVLTYTRVDGVVDMQYFAYSPGLTVSPSPHNMNMYSYSL